MSAFRKFVVAKLGELYFKNLSAFFLLFSKMISKRAELIFLLLFFFIVLIFRSWKWNSSMHYRTTISNRTWRFETPELRWVLFENFEKGDHFAKLLERVHLKENLGKTPGFGGRTDEENRGESGQRIGCWGAKKIGRGGKFLRFFLMAASTFVPKVWVFFLSKWEKGEIT